MKRIAGIVLTILALTSLGAGFGASAEPLFQLNGAQGFERIISEGGGTYWPLYGNSVGEMGGSLVLRGSSNTWDIKSNTQGGGSNDYYWKVSKDLKTVSTIPESSVDNGEKPVMGWNSRFSEGKDVKFQIEAGTVVVGNQKLFKIPDWADGTGEMSTMTYVHEFPGHSGELVYRINWMTVPRNYGASVHDFSTYVYVIVKNNQAHCVQAGTDQRIPRAFLIAPVFGGGYLAYGDFPGPDIDGAAFFTADGKFSIVNDVITEKMKLSDGFQPQLMGIRDGSVLFFVRSQTDPRKTEICEIDSKLNIKKCPENLEKIREISNWDSALLGADGTVYTIARDGEMIYDLTHHRSLDLLAGQKVIGNYCPYGSKTVKISKTGKTVTLPVYFYKGDTCLCAEDLNGRGFSMKWDPKLRETRLTSAPVKVTAKASAMKGGPIYRSDVVVLFNGIAVPSYNTGGKSLVSISVLESKELFQQ